MPHIKVNQDFSGEVKWNGWSESFRNVAADAREQLGLSGNQPQATIGLSDEDIQGYFIQGDTLNHDPDYVKSLD